MSDLSKNHFASVIGKSEVWDFVRSLRKSLGSPNGEASLHQLHFIARSREVAVRIRAIFGILTRKAIRYSSQGLQHRVLAEGPSAVSSQGMTFIGQT